MISELTAKQVRQVCDSSLFKCNSTEEMTPLEGIIGQERALSALKFGLNMPKDGFNVFVSGIAGTGKTTATKAFLDALAATKDIPPDWCYVYNFRDPYCPRSLKVPPGTGTALQQDMKRLVEDAGRSLSQAFTSKEYVDRRAEITESLEKKKGSAFTTLGNKAQERGFLLRATQIGLIFVPLSDDKPMSEEEFGQLSPDKKEELRQKQEELTKELKSERDRLREEERAAEKQLEDVDGEVARYATSYLFEELKNNYSHLAQVVEFIKDVEQDITANFAQFKPEPHQHEDGPMAAMQSMLQKQNLAKYEVNVLVDNSPLQGAPVILELNPTFNNLFGRIEKETQFGALYTDFTMIRSGSLHRANGGYLVVRTESLLNNFQSWDGLKRTLRDGKLIIEEIGERLGFIVTKTLRPEPIPLDVKVLIIGEPTFYYALLHYDSEFKELFKVKADFDTQMDKTEAELNEYARVICRMCQQEPMRHLDSSALAKIIEHSSRLAGDQEKLSTMFSNIADIVREANFWASDDGGQTKVIDANHIMKAIEQKVYRSNLIQQRINEMIN
ncbi:MAG: AAA family ATPase, partial [Chloroflexi bacterium]|nr:AAA family ATPase [Chloroflexota bacterium]